MQTLPYSFQNIIDGHGFSIAITGMLIVFAALVLISLFIAALPKVLEAVSGVFPEKVDSHVQRASGSIDPSVVAAIGFALHQRASGGGSA